MNFKIITCNSNKTLSNELVVLSEKNKVSADIRRFSDGEIFVQINENLRGHDVFIVQSTCPPVNDNLMELLVTIDAAKRASAKSITAVIPYFGYARQDRKPSPRTPISAKLVADLIERAGATSIVTLDLHADQIQGFFNVPVDNISAGFLFVEHIKKHFSDKNIIITSPDVGGVVRSRFVAKKLDVGIAIIDKRREKPGVSEVMNIIGDVNGKDCIIIDDIVDSAGTLCNAALALTNAGAKSVTAYISHGVLSGSAIDKIASSALTKLFITNSIEPSLDANKCSKIETISIAKIIWEIISRITHNMSVSEIF